MKKIPLLCAGVALAFSPVSGVAFAAKADATDKKAMAKYDTNKDGKLDAEEFALVRRDFAAKPTGDLAWIDTDRDGKLSDNELAVALPARRKVKSEAEKTERKAQRQEKKRKPAAEPLATTEAKPAPDAKPEPAAAKPAPDK